MEKGSGITEGVLFYIGNVLKPPVSLFWWFGMMLPWKGLINLRGRPVMLGEVSVI